MYSAVVRTVQEAVHFADRSSCGVDICQGSAKTSEVAEIGDVVERDRRLKAQTLPELGKPDRVGEVGIERPERRVIDRRCRRRSELWLHTLQSRELTWGKETCCEQRLTSRCRLPSVGGIVVVDETIQPCALDFMLIVARESAWNHVAGSSIASDVRPKDLARCLVASVVEREGRCSRRVEMTDHTDDKAVLDGPTTAEAQLIGVIKARATLVHVGIVEVVGQGVEELVSGVASRDRVDDPGEAVRDLKVAGDDTREWMSLLLLGNDLKGM
jgi:hypothetical protein